MVSVLPVTLWLCVVTLGSGSGKDVARDGSTRLSWEEVIWNWKRKTGCSDFKHLQYSWMKW